MKIALITVTNEAFLNPTVWEGQTAWSEGNPELIAEYHAADVVIGQFPGHEPRIIKGDANTCVVNMAQQRSMYSKDGFIAQPFARVEVTQPATKTVTCEPVRVSS